MHTQGILVYVEKNPNNFVSLSFLICRYRFVYYDSKRFVDFTILNNSVFFHLFLWRIGYLCAVFRKCSPFFPNPHILWSHLCFPWRQCGWHDRQRHDGMMAWWCDGKLATGFACLSNGHEKSYKVFSQGFVRYFVRGWDIQTIQDFKCYQFQISNVYFISGNRPIVYQLVDVSVQYAF